MRLGAACVALSLAMVARTVPAEEVSPNLPVAAWKSAPVNLEDFKGQVVVLVFYNDSKA
jgi:peroxiredoxin